MKTSNNSRGEIRLTALALAAAALASSAAAQQAPSPASTTEPAAVVTVTGFRASLDSALNAKKNSDGILDVIKAEDIAKFPDANLAESLQRVPGVALARGDGGEGKQITVRGLNAGFTRVRINGIEGVAATGSSDINGSTNRGRGFDFSVFASELFNSLEVRKTSEAAVEEGSLAGGFGSAVMEKCQELQIDGVHFERIGVELTDEFMLGGGETRSGGLHDLEGREVIFSTSGPAGPMAADAWSLDSTLSASGSKTRSSARSPAWPRRSPRTSLSTGRGPRCRRWQRSRRSSTAMCSPSSPAARCTARCR